MKVKHDNERSEWSKRPYFTPRQLLSARQLNAGLDDELSRQRLLSRAVHGYGVVFGFEPKLTDDGSLQLEDECLHLGCGLAIDRHGRMLYWDGGWIGMDHIEGRRPDCEGPYTLCLHYAERPPRPDGCLPFSSDESKWRGQGVVFTLRPECEPADRVCADHPDQSCIGHDEYLCRRTGGTTGSGPDSLPPSPDIEWLCAEPGPLCPTDCGTWLYDPNPAVCVPLACLRICDLANPGGESTAGADESQPQYESGEAPSQEHEPARYPKPEPTEPDCDPRYGFCPSRPELCKVRPFVYRNPLLYDLVNCCDVELPRVESISWQEWIDRGWHSKVPWPEFETRIRSYADGFVIRFSKPIKISTLHQGSISLTAMYKERRTDYWVSQAVPFREVQPIDEVGELAGGVRLLPEVEWLRAEVTGDRSTLFAGARFELAIRGQLLRDECDGMLDARPLDLACGTRCQARPGDDFLSVFQVAARDRYYEPTPVEENVMEQQPDEPEKADQ